MVGMACRRQPGTPSDASARSPSRLVADQALEGVVQDAKEHPLPDALVLIWPAGRVRGQQDVRQARAGADGRFAFDGLHRGDWTLLAEAPGFGTLQIDRVAIPGKPLVLALEGESRTLGGLVLGAKIAARVRLGGVNLRVPREGETDSRGAFLFRGLGRGRYSVRASAGRLASDSASTIIDEATSWVAPVRLTLEPGAFVEGTVADEVGRPLAGVNLELTALPVDDLPELGTTDDRGRFSIGPVPPGRYQLLARAPQHILLDAPELRLRPETPSSVQLRLARSARLSGRAMDGQGKPLAGVAVSIVGLVGGNDELTVLRGALPLAAEAAGLPGQTLARRGRARTTITDARGRFRLDDVPPGRIRLDLAHADALPFRREPILLAPGDAQDLGDLALPSGVQLTGRVLDEGGRPLPGARVEARPMRAPSSLSVRAASDREGRFSLRVPRGEYLLIGLAPERAPQSIPSVRAEGSPPALELRLPVATGVVEGQVRDAAGRPVARASVAAWTPPAALTAAPGSPWAPRPIADLSSASAPLTLASAATDPGGRFRLVGLPTASVVIEARHAEFAAGARVARAGDRVAIDLPRPGGIQGEVRERGSAAFITRYDLEATGPEGARPDRVDIRGAAFTLLGLAPGSWTIKINAQHHEAAVQTVEVPAGTSRRVPSVRDVRIEIGVAAAP